MAMPKFEEVLGNWIAQAIPPTSGLPEDKTPAQWVTTRMMAWWQEEVGLWVDDIECDAHAMKRALEGLGGSKDRGLEHAMDMLMPVDKAVGDLRVMLGIIDESCDSPDERAGLSRFEEVLGKWIAAAMSPTSDLPKDQTPAQWVSKKITDWLRTELREQFSIFQGAAGAIGPALENLAARRAGGAIRRALRNLSGRRDDKLDDATHQLTHLEGDTWDLRWALGIVDAPRGCTTDGQR